MFVGFEFLFHYFPTTMKLCTFSMAYGVIRIDFSVFLKVLLVIVGLCRL